MMLPLGVNGYSADEVKRELHAVDGTRRVEFIYRLLNRENVRIGTLEVIGGTVDMSSMAAVKRSARFTIKEDKGVDWLNDRIQPVFRLGMPDGGYAEWPLGVFLMSSPARKDTGGGITRDVTAYDSCVILEKDRFLDRYVIQAGTNYISAINAILISADVGYALITANSGELSTAREFEGGTSKLAAINTLFSEINYTDIWADENGRLRASPYILPYYADSEYSYRSDETSIMLPEPVNEFDLFDVPNKWVVSASSPDAEPLMSIFVNDRLTSLTSTINRGRTISQYHTVNNIVDQATLDNYARRLAYEDSAVFDVMRFETAVMPHHSYHSNLFLEHNAFDMASRFQEVSWSMPLDAMQAMRHEARRVILL